MGQDRPFRPETDGRYLRPSWPWSCRPRKTVRKQQHVVPELPSGSRHQEIRPTFRRGLRRFSAVSLTRRRSRHAGRADQRLHDPHLNGRALPLGSDEMKAFVAYIKFLSADRPIGAKTLGCGSGEMAELTRPAVSRRQGLRADLCRVPRR